MLLVFAPVSIKSLQLSFYHIRTLDLMEMYGLFISIVIAVQQFADGPCSFTLAGMMKLYSVNTVDSHLDDCCLSLVSRETYSREKCT